MELFDVSDVWFYLGLATMGLSAVTVIVAFIRYARKKLSDGFMMIWLLLGTIGFILGITLIITGFSYVMMVGVTVVAASLLFSIVFITSSMVSELMMKVRELAMQVALLNQENDSLLQQINSLKEQDKDA